MSGNWAVVGSLSQIMFAFTAMRLVTLTVERAK